jgi:hypothetical protein
VTNSPEQNLPLLEAARWPPQAEVAPSSC